MKTTIRFKDGITFRGQKEIQVDAIGKHFAYVTIDGENIPFPNDSYDQVKVVSFHTGGFVDGPKEVFFGGGHSQKMITGKGLLAENPTGSIKEGVEALKEAFSNMGKFLNGHKLPFIPASTKIIPAVITPKTLENHGLIVKNGELTTLEREREKEAEEKAVQGAKDEIDAIANVMKFASVSASEAADMMRLAKENGAETASIDEEYKRKCAVALETAFDDLPYTDKDVYIEELEGKIKAIRLRSEAKGKKNKELNERCHLVMKANEELRRENEGHVSDIQNLKGELRSHEASIEGLLQERDKWMKEAKDMQLAQSKLQKEITGGFERERDIEQLTERLVQERDDAIEKIIVLESDNVFLKRVINKLV